MPPETPKHGSGGKPASVTPSFTFNLGFLPCFRFASPRNINFLASMSPQRLVKFPRKDDRNVSFDKSDSLSADSDIWSLTNDSHDHGVSLNVTSITEEPGENGYLAPQALLPALKSLLRSSPLEKSPSPAETPSRKRKRSVDDLSSPTSSLAAKVDSFGSPVISAQYSEPPTAAETWNTHLDDVLLRCQKKYRLFQAAQSPGLSLAKCAPQNKILAKMLYSKTGAFRSARQVGSRLSRLKKASPAPASQPVLSLRNLSISFVYKQSLHEKHSFTELASPQINWYHDPKDIDSLLLHLHFVNDGLKKELHQLHRSISGSNAPVYTVSTPVNMRPNQHSTSTPVSPLTDPLLFSIHNGKFLSFVDFFLPPSDIKNSFLSLKSHVTIYKGHNSVMASSTELVNGYRNSDGSYKISSPFMCNFWAGLLTFISNGSQNTSEIDQLQVTQVIYDGRDEEVSGKIYGYFVYEFHAVETESSAPASIKAFFVTGDKENKPPAREEDDDDNATVLASSSPAKITPTKIRAPLSVDTMAANQAVNLSNEPTYDANVLHHFNPNYSGPLSAPVFPKEMGYPNDLNNEMALLKANGQLYPPVHTPVLAVDMRVASAGQMPVGNVPMQQPMVNAQQMCIPPPNRPFDDNSMPRWDSGEMMMNPGVMPGMTYNVSRGPVPPAPMINSAPASQLQFFPQQPPAPAPQPKVKKEDKSSGITFGPILGYDPLKDVKAAKKAKGNVNFHKFPLNPQVMYKPKP